MLSFRVKPSRRGAEMWKGLRWRWVRLLVSATLLVRAPQKEDDTAGDLDDDSRVGVARRSVPVSALDIVMDARSLTKKSGAVALSVKAAQVVIFFSVDVVVCKMQIIQEAALQRGPYITTSDYLVTWGLPRSRDQKENGAQ